MSVESKLLRRALDGELKNLFRDGFDPKILCFPYNIAFERLIEFHRKHGQMPGSKRLQAECEDLGGVTIASSTQSTSKASVYWEQIIRGYLDNDTATTLETVVQEYNKKLRKPGDFLSFALRKMSDLDLKYRMVTGKATSPSLLASRLREDYCLTETGKMPGISIEPNFRLFADAFGKWRPGHITTVAGRSSVGKSWLCLIQCLYAAMCGHKVLIASMEMTDLDLDRRLTALAAMVNFNDTIHGKLSGKAREKWIATIAAQERGEGYWANIRYMKPEAIDTIDSVERQAEQFGADLVLADAFYDFPEDSKGSENRKGWEKINENLLRVRTLSLISNRHWFLTAQFNKSVTGLYTADEFGMGGSDKFNAISNNVIYMVQRKRDKTNLQVILIIGKGRDAAPQRPWIHHWNFFMPCWLPISVYTENQTVTKTSTKGKRYM